VVVAERFVHGFVQVPLHVGVVLLGGLALFATRLLQHEDQDKLAAMPLGRGWAGRLRDLAVLGMGVLERAAGGRRSA